MNANLIDITVIVQHQTESAVLVDHGDAEAVWLPLSQIEIAPSDDGKSHIVTLPEWLATEKGLV